MQAEADSGGPVGYLFTDIDGSTEKWEKSADEMARAQARHDTLIAEVVAKNGGHIHDRAGDGVFAIFRNGNPIQCALDLQRALQAQDWQSVGGLEVRIGVHCGAAENSELDKVSANRAARIMATGWGGQTVISAAAAEAFHLPVACELADLGMCRLKGVPQPFHLFGLVHPQLARNEFPPLRTILSHAHAAPRPTTPMYGRREEMRDILARLAAAPELTIVGSGGNGKTRLVLEIALRVSEQAPVYFAPLEAVATDAQLVIAFGAALRLPFHGRASQEVQIVDYLRDKDALIVLDNADQLVGQTGLLTRILGGCSGIQILATSREPLSIEGENVFHLFGLRSPQASDAAFRATPSCELFIAEARAINPSFDLRDGDARTFAEICDLLSGSPLGLQLTAQWTQLLTMGEILERLRSGVSFLGELGAVQGDQLASVFAGSWSLLEHSQQSALARLSVFRGGFDRQAAEYVAGAEIATLGLLERKCLLERREHRRFMMHPLIHEYARERLRALAESADAETRRRHARYFLDFVGLSYAAAKGGEQAQMLDLIERDLFNLSSAWAHAVEIEDHDRLRDVAEAVFYSLSHRSRFRDCGAMFAIETTDSELNAHFQSIRANCQVHQGNYQAAETMARKTLSDCAAATLASAHCHHALAGIAHARGDFQSAGLYYETALSERTELGDLIGSYYSAMSLAWLELQRGNIAGARKHVSESYRLCQHAGHLGGMLAVHVCAGDIAVREGRADDALASYRQALAVEDSVRHPQHRAATLVKLGAIYMRRDSLDLAQDRLEEALELAELVGDVRIAVNARLALARVLKRTGDLHTAGAELRLALAQAHGLDIGHQLVAILIELARMALERGEARLAARIAGALRSCDLGPAEEEWGALMADVRDGDMPAHTELDDIVLELINENQFGLLRM